MQNKKQIPKLLLISGPTSVGKTQLALKLAQKFEGELISADSRQVYIGLDFGTNKFANDKDLWHYDKNSKIWFFEGISVYLYDQITPNQNFSAYAFYKLATFYIKDISSRGKLPIVVGAAGFYQRALIYPFKSLGIAPNFKLRAGLEKLTTRKLVEKLQINAPNIISKIDLNNRRRVIRAIEKTQLQHAARKIPKMDFDYLWIGLKTSRETLYKRVDNWIIDNHKKIIYETKKQLKNYKKESPPFQGVIYKTIISYLEKPYDKLQLITKLQSELHKNIRQQLTWFNNEKEIVWFDINDSNFLKNVTNYVEKWYIKKIKD